MANESLVASFKEERNHVLIIIEPDETQSLVFLVRKLRSTEIFIASDDNLTLHDGFSSNDSSEHNGRHISARIFHDMVDIPYVHRD